MSVDPGSIPSFWVPHWSPAQVTGASAVPGRPLLGHLLEEMGLRYALDGEGGVFFSGNNHYTRCDLYGENEDRVLWVQTFFAPIPSQGEIGDLVAFADEWNRSTLWPKLYSRNDGEELSLVGESCMFVSRDIGLSYLQSCFASFVHAATECSELFSAAFMRANGDDPMPADDA
ncbi:YbjN domain-containing protein [Streptomyces sp. NRRL F-2664]|uniref:YbjN domain-containing protein n=1 Tax=Streptomyces sp. NRRL F-2664 TaxID=1463842 RepID=UPI00131E43D5|nr:YbjN domain-containing protein [Streptomyces sp. NRRL F-2664]